MLPPAVLKGSKLKTFAKAAKNQEQNKMKKKS